LSLSLVSQVQTEYADFLPHPSNKIQNNNDLGYGWKVDVSRVLASEVYLL
jgi:hypothetical protein